MTFRDREKERLVPLKSELFSPEACEPGSYRGIVRPFCLAEGYSRENLYEGFRDDALDYFRERNITWHNGLGQRAALPSNHLCCSQAACVNTLWPLTRDPGLLAACFHPFLSELAEPLPMVADGALTDGALPFLSFEWIGTQNYLEEVGNRRRGANATSVDFAFRFRRNDRRVQLVLGEWKYTEQYGKDPAHPETINQTQLRVYREAFARWSAGRDFFPPYETFFVEPFYQFMRQTLLAQEMQRASITGQGEMNADMVSLLHISPQANHEFSDNLAAAPALASYGRTVCEAWARLAPPVPFLSISAEQLLAQIEQVTSSSLQPWSRYLLRRYGWWQSAAAGETS